MLHGDAVYIWPTMAHEPDKPKIGMFSVKLGKAMPERALRVECEDGIYTVCLDGFPCAKATTVWKDAFGPKLNSKGTLIGRPLGKDEYDRLVTRNLQASFDGINLDVPINLNVARPPF